jgi:hypothetical protein
MKLETGMIVIIGALAIFYLRMMQLRGKKKRLEREKVLTHMREAGRKKGKLAPLPPKDPNAPPFKVTSWILVIISIVLMLLGMACRSYDVFPKLMQDYWWGITTIGILVFMFCFKVE